MLNWTEDEIKFLKDNYPIKSNDDIAILLNKTKKAVDAKAIRLELKKDVSYIKSINTSRINAKWGDDLWTKQDIDYLSENFDILSNNELSSKMNRTVNSIQTMIQRLGLKRSKKYTKDFIEKECLKYVTKQELKISDPNLYAWLYMNRKIDDVTKHMLNISYSTPQLILKSILEKITGKKISYNNRKAISPYEIDILFEDEKLGFEYDGKYYHNNGSDFKRHLCERKGITLITINETGMKNKSFDTYVNNISSKLILNLSIINEALHMNIESKDISNIEIIKSDIFSNILSIEKIKKVCMSYNDYTTFIREQNTIYHKLLYLGLIDDYTQHMTTSNRSRGQINRHTKENYSFIIEMSNFYKKGDLIIIEYWYNGMLTVCKIEDIIGRRYKISHNVESSKIKNAPDEVISTTDIIDRFKTK